MHPYETRLHAPLKIIRSSAPIRINDIGGWTDTWFSETGKVLNMAVSPCVEVSIHAYKNRNKREDRVLLQVLNYGESFRIIPEKPDMSRHPLLQAAVNSIPPPTEYEAVISIHSGVPPGISTGTSASVCVALLGALASLAGKILKPEDIASLAHQIETVQLGLQSGIQDQFCAALGGICFIHMHSYPDAYVERILVLKSAILKLQKRLSLVSLGQPHRSSALHDQVIRFLKAKGSGFHVLKKLRILAEKARNALISSDIEAFGKIMIQNTECQRALHPALVSRKARRLISLAKKHGASGWKVNGAGGDGGSLTILGSEDQRMRDNLIAEIKAMGGGIQVIPVSLNFAGLITEEVPSSF